MYKCCMLLGLGLGMSLVIHANISSFVSNGVLSPAMISKIPVDTRLNADPELPFPIDVED